MANVYPRPGAFSLIEINEQEPAEEYKLAHETEQARVDEKGVKHPTLKARLDAKAIKDETEMASKSYVVEQIVEVNTGGTIDLSSKADVTYVDDKVDENKVLTFEKLTDLQTAYPNGLNRPVWVEAENMWYSWQPEIHESYLADNASSKSTTAYWKGVVTTIKQDITLTEVGAVGSPTNWELWDVVAGKLSTKLSSGVFTDTITDVSSHYNKSALATPVQLDAGKSYILIVKYDAIASYYTAVENALHDDFLDVVAGTHNIPGVPTAGYSLGTTTSFAYKHYLKYEV